MYCQLCKEKQAYYKCPWMGGMSEPRKWIDAEWISRMCEMTHLEAGADRIQTYPFPRTPTFEITEKWLFGMACFRWRQDNPEEWELFEENGFEDGEIEKIMIMDARCDIALFRQGLVTDEGQGDFDFPDKEVEWYAVGYSGYHGE
jgi:hypothetical protein